MPKAARTKDTEKHNDEFTQLDVNEIDEQLGKDIIVGRKEISYEDGMNVISVIINAIGVRINMPRGTIKVLMACFVVLLTAALIYGINVLRDWSTLYYETAEYQKAVDDIKYNLIKGAEDVHNINLSREIVLPKKEVVISENYSFIVPAGYFDEYAFSYGKLFMNMQAHGFYNSNGDYFVVSSYITKEGIADKDLQTVVMDRLKEANDVRNIRYEQETFEYGELVVLRYEAFKSDEPSIFAAEYSWQDDDGTICSLDISSDTGDIEETAKHVLSSVHRKKGGLTNDELIDREKELYSEDYPEEYDPDDPVGMGEVDPYTVMEPDIDEIRKQEAMEAWEEYSKLGQEPDISDRIIKP